MCDNFEEYYRPKGWDYVLTKARCGTTKIDGSRAICEPCATDPRRMAEIRLHEANSDADNAWARSAGWGEF